MNQRYIFQITCIIFINITQTYVVDTTLMPRPGNPFKSRSQIVEGRLNQSVWDRGLVKKDGIKPRDIYRNVYGYYSDIRFRVMENAMVVGYVANWNPRGFDVLRRFCRKFTHVIPIWFVYRKENDYLYVDGSDNVDKEWITDIRNISEGQTKVMPRIGFNDWTPEMYEELFNKPDKYAQTLINDTLYIAEKFGVDGFVLDPFEEITDIENAIKIGKICVKIATALKEGGYQVMLGAPAADGEGGMFSKNMFDTTEFTYDAIILKSYAFSNAANPGPMNPKWWLEGCVRYLVPDDGDERRKKVLIGTNFSGLDYSDMDGKDCTGTCYLEGINKIPKIRFDEVTEEHYFHYHTLVHKRTVYFPSLYTIWSRVEMCKSLKCGMAFFEVGASLDYFYDLI